VTFKKASDFPFPMLSKVSVHKKFPTTLKTEGTKNENSVDFGTALIFEKPLKEPKPSIND
jgi:hypothetical protein